MTETSPGHDALDRLGEVLDGRYLLRNLVGIGGNGAVYQADVVGVGHRVAVKVLHPVLSADSTARRRLEREARLASQIDHPNVVGVVDFRSSAELTYLVMEYLSGVSLAEVLQEVGYLSVRRAIHIARQVLLALETSHRVGVLHRDMKPENIYLTARQDDLDFVKVLDFGMALATDGGDERITAAGRICGTPAYMSPEQVRNRTLTVQSDFYAVGVIVYECLTGQNPFLTKGASGTMVNQVTLQPPPPSEQCKEAEIPPYLDAVVMRALRKDPDERFASAEEFRWVLEGLALAHQQPAPLQLSALTTCGECGQVNKAAAKLCEGCGQPLDERVLERQTMAPDMIDALEATNSHDREYELSPTTVTVHRPVGWIPPLVGRKREQALIKDLVDFGPPPCAQRFLRVIGRPGSGKARLAREVMVHASQPGWRRLWISPQILPVFSALHPIRHMVAKLLGLPARQRDGRALLASARDFGVDVASHGDGLLELFGLAADSTVEVVSRRASRAHALREVMRAATSQSPLLLVFQDVHLYDAPSQELVAALVSPEPYANPLCVVATHDPDLLLLWGETTALNLSSLGSKEAAELAGVLFKQLKIPGDARQVVESSGGNPLMLLELCRLAATGIELQRPRGLAEVVDRRISQLPARARALLHAIAVLGRPVSAGEVGIFLAEPRQEDEQTLRFLSSAGFLASEGDAWQLAHRVHREVAYSTTPVALRQALHLKAAKRGIDDDAPSAFIAHHLYEGGRTEQALPFLLRAGKSALAALDDRLAVDTFNRAFRLLASPQVGQEAQQRDYWMTATVGMAQALRDGGDPRAAQRWLRQAEAQARAALWQQEADLLR